MAVDDEQIEEFAGINYSGSLFPHPFPNHPSIPMMMKFSLGPPYVSPVDPLVTPPVECQHGLMGLRAQCQHGVRQGA